MYRPIYFLYAVVVLILSWEMFSFYQNVYHSYENIVGASTEKNLALSEAINTAVVNQPKEKKINVMFFGDVMLSRSVGKMIAEKNDPRFPFLLLASSTSQADILFANLEGPISNRGENQGSIYSFRADPRVVEGLTYAGFDVMSLANNHMWDWGADALTDTVAILKANDILPVGAGINEQEANAPVFIKRRNTTFGFLAYTTLMPKSLEARETSPGFSHFDREKMKESIKKAKEQADIVIVSLHWGEEYKTEASDEQRQLARELIDAGADFIAGHHPHVVEELEAYKNGWIAFSLGNFIFDQTFSMSTRQGLGVVAVVQGKKIVELRKIPTNTSLDFQASLGDFAW